MAKRKVKFHRLPWAERQVILAARREANPARKSIKATNYVKKFRVLTPGTGHSVFGKAIPAATVFNRGQSLDASKMLANNEH